MKGLLRIFVFHFLAVLFTVQIFQGAFTIKEPQTNYLLAAGVLTLLNILLKPILKLLFFPINVLTLGLFSLVVNVLVFYLFVRLTPAVMIRGWYFPGLSFQNFTLSPAQLGQLPTLLILSLAMSLITNFLAYLVE